MVGDVTEFQGADERRRAQIRSLDRLQPPTQVPGFDIERFLGAGAFGEVWVALDRNTGRRVAIKFYAHRGGLDWSLLTREVEKLAFLSTDRYVVQLMSVGWDADPPFYVMEYLEHGSLEERLQAGPMPVHEAVAMFREVCIGLVHAHNKGVLHCDLKPANVLLDQDFKPRLADFGQSRLSHEQTPALGTLFYMAPEQADLKANPDARWDVYALGALLYRMLTGEPPYRSNELARELESAPNLEQRLAKYRRFLRDAKKPKDHRKIPGVDSALADILERCLAVNPAKRFSNAQAVLDELNLRQQRRARRPLLLVGALGPALLLLVTAAFAWNAFDTALDDSRRALVKRALDSNQFAARFLAETAARDMDRRWRILETEASEVRILLEAAKGQPPESEERGALQRWIVRRHAEHGAVNNAESWFITDATGTQLARSPHSSSVGQNYSHRDYFHGQGQDVPKGTADIQPIREVHRSNMYDSDSSHRRMLAFTVPIWSATSDDDTADVSTRQVLGVLGMSVEVGSFGEMKWQKEKVEDQTQVAVLADVKNIWKDRSGLILQHPQLAQLRMDKPNETLPSVFLDAELLPLANALRAERLQQASVKQIEDDDYHDPLATLFPVMQGRWLAAMEPVIVNGRPPAVADTGWIAIVQERYSTATSPVADLQAALLQRGLWALGIIAVVLTGLWLFVIRVLNDSSQVGLLGTFRKRTGLAGESLGSTGTGAGRGSTGNTGLTGLTGTGAGGTGAGRASDEPAKDFHPPAPPPAIPASELDQTPAAPRKPPEP